LITAASLAATVGGWAVLSANNTNTSSQTSAVPVQPTAPTFTINLEPLPTLVPTPASSPRLVMASNRPALPQPAAAPALPTLRSVTGPTGGGGGGPAPAGTSRSSR
jgi:hypothetical protein